MTNLTMSVGRDYRMTGWYEYAIFAGEQLVDKKGGFSSYSSAKRAGLKAADAITETACAAHVEAQSA